MSPIPSGISFQFSQLIRYRKKKKEKEKKNKRLIGEKWEMAGKKQSEKCNQAEIARNQLKPVDSNAVAL